MVPRFFLILCGLGSSCVLQILQADFSVCSRESVFLLKIAHGNGRSFRRGKPPQEGAAAFSREILAGCGGEKPGLQEGGRHDTMEERSIEGDRTVSYTHLDVYKRQGHSGCPPPGCGPAW